MRKFTRRAEIRTGNYSEFVQESLEKVGKVREALGKAKPDFKEAQKQIREMYTHAKQERKNAHHQIILLMENVEKAIQHLVKAPFKSTALADMLNKTIAIFRELSQRYNQHLPRWDEKEREIITKADELRYRIGNAKNKKDQESIQAVLDHLPEQELQELKAIIDTVGETEKALYEKVGTVENHLKGQA